MAQLSLEQVLAQARQETPLLANLPLITAEQELKLDNLKRNWRPQISVLGQATYQSEVTEIEIPLPGIEIDPLSKDQYQLQAELNQAIYDGGQHQRQKALQLTASAIERERVEVELEKLRRQIIQNYFAVLQIDAQLQLLALKKEDLAARQQVVEAAVANGTLLKMEAQSLAVARLELEQQVTGLRSQRQAQLLQLALLTQREIDDQIELLLPASPSLPTTYSSSKNLAMHRLFSLQDLSLDQQNELENTKLQPRMNAFVQGGYGRPGLNFLKNEFTPYYIVGARIQWNLSAWYTKSNRSELRVLGQQKIQNQRQNYNRELERQEMIIRREIDKLQIMIAQDRSIYELREQIHQTAAIQLENGVMTSADYLIRFNEANQAKEQKVLHEIQLRQQQYLLQHLAGDYTIQ